MREPYCAAHLAVAGPARDRLAQAPVALEPSFGHGSRIQQIVNAGSGSGTRAKSER